MAALQKRSIDAIRANQAELAKEWQGGLATGGGGPRDISAEDLSRQTSEFLRLLLVGAAEGDTTNLADSDWSEVRSFLEKLSRSRAQLGFDPQHTINFIYSLKRSVFGLLQREFGKDPAFLAEQLWAVSELIDAFGMHTMRTFQKSREEVITRQQEELLELSTPVVKLWDGVLALPMIGTLDSRRTQTVMESLLQRIVDTGAEIAIIDITGVPTVDTLVAQHLLKTVTAIRLMGADCIISGVRPQIAQTIVHLGLDLEGIVTKANLSDALALALRRRGLTVTATAAA